MKKTLGTLIALGLIAGALIAPASAGKKKPQVVEGSIYFPAPFLTGIPNNDDGCFAGLHRRIFTIGGGQPNGVFGYEFDIDKATWNKKFVLEPTGGEGTVDLDVAFYIHYPDLAEAQGAPYPNFGNPVTVDFQNRAEGGEKGKVPPETTKAVVCLYGGASGYAGFNATFSYKAG